MPTRRQFLRRSGAITAGVVLGTSSSRAATGASEEYWDAQPDHVTIEYNKATLETYRPMLVTRNLVFRPQALHGWVARSSEYETSVAVYWAEYLSQRGWTLEDSHDGDHEPCYVLYDSSTGKVQEVIYSAYHWLAARATPSTVELYDDTHAKLDIVRPWHQYRLTSETGELVEIADLTVSFDSWLANGLADSLQPGTVTNPWLMTGSARREHWWRESAGGFALDAFVARSAFRASQAPFVDFGGASEADL